ncbi:MAG: hypothetical protein ACYC27_17735 [Armatimonadota bacterium]
MANADDEYRGWRVVEGPGTETTNEDTGPHGRDLGKEPVAGAGYGASTGGVDGEPGPPGAAPGEIPEHTGPTAVAGTDLLGPPDNEADD